MEWAMVPPKGFEVLVQDDDEAKLLVSGVQKAIDNSSVLGLAADELAKLTEFTTKFETPLDY